MKGLIPECAAALPLMLCVPGLAAADLKCKTEFLTGEYVFTASGFTRPPDSLPGTHWLPKAILQVLQFNGDGTLTTTLTLANPFGDTGAILRPPPHADPDGTYSVNDDCSGTVQFFDARSVAFKIHVDGPAGATISMLQTNPGNNVLQGSAKRVR
jgi:hypothetical protein